MKSKRVSIFSVSVLAAFFLSAQLVHAGDPADLGDIVRNADGSVRKMNQYDAEKYCKEQGTRLPTARELALYSQSLGARGIRETAYPGKNRDAAAVQLEIHLMGLDDYHEIETINGVGERVVDFYFNNSGYQRPEGDLGIYWFRSTAVHPVDFINAYYLNGDDRDVYYDYRSYEYSYSAVRCVR